MKLNYDRAVLWKLGNVLRWLCVLPAAVLGGIVAQFILGAAFQIARYGGSDNVGNSGIGYWLMVFLNYVPRQLAFVVAGAMASPRYRRTTAIGLAVLGISLSLMRHIVGQHLAGNRVGLINYTHLTAETAGALGGAAYIFFRDWRRRPAGMAE